MQLGKLHLVAPALLAFLLTSMALQGCSSASKSSSVETDDQDLVKTMSEPCGDECSVTYYCSNEEKLEIEVKGCTLRASAELESTRPTSEAKDMQTCKRQLKTVKGLWEARKERVCFSLQAPREVEFECAGDCQVKYACTDDGQQITQVVGCKKDARHEDFIFRDLYSCQKAIDSEIKLFKEKPKVACGGFVGETSLVSDSFGPKPAPSMDLASLTETKGFYMLLGGAVVALLYLLFRWIVVAVRAASSPREVQEKLGSWPAAAANLTELRQAAPMSP